MPQRRASSPSLRFLGLNLKLLSILLLLAGVVLTVFLALQQQDIRQRASEGASPVFWQTDHASVTADDFYIIANGKRFNARDAEVRLNSSAPFPPNFKSTTLEAEWWENGVEMRMHFYFEQVNGVWRVTEARTYNGNFRGDWIFYDGFAGGAVGTSLDQASFDLTSKQNPYNPSDTIAGSIHFTNMRLKPYLTQIPSSGYYIYRSNSSIKTPISQPNTSYGVYTFLFKDGNVVHDQSNVTYQWSVDDSIIASIRPYTESYDCQTNQISPCPQSRVEVRGLIPGSTTVHLKVLDSTTQQVLALTSIAVQVTPSPTPTPTMMIATPTPTPTLTPTATPPIPSLTPTSTGIVSITPSPVPVRKDARLTLKALCYVDAGTLRWEVGNPNTHDILFTYQFVGYTPRKVTTNGTGVVSANSKKTIETTRYRLVNMLTLFVETSFQNRAIQALPQKCR